MTPSAWRDGGQRRDDPLDHVRQPAWRDVDRGDVEGHLPADLRRQRESLHRLFPKATIVKDEGGLRELVEGALAGDRAAAGRARPSDRRCRNRLPGSGVARAAQDPGRRDPKLCRNRGGDRPAQSGPRGRHRQRRQPRLGADPVPPRDPQRRVARRLCRRARSQEELLAAEGHAVAEPELPLAE